MSKIDRMVQIDAATKLVPGTEPVRGGNPGAKEAFLLLHGFTGFPAEMNTLGMALAELGFAYASPRYPGHGTNRADFSATRAEDWLRRALDSYLELRADYEAVHVLGYSMGGLIAALAATAFDAPKLVLLAPAFASAARGEGWVPLVAPFMPVRRQGRPNDAPDETRRLLFADYYADDLVAGAAQLLRLRKAGRRALPRLRSKTFLLVGSEDTIVSPSVGDYVGKRARRAAAFESRILEGAKHSFVFDERASETAIIVRDWVSRA
jgi:carboxylesterase